MAPPPNSENGQSSKSSSSEGTSRPPLRFHFLTLFPEIFAPALESSLLGKAQKKGLVEFETHRIRDFATDKHRTVDDTPYGGGAGMLMRVDVLHAAWKAAQAPRAPEVPGERVATILLSPQGALFNQGMAKELAASYDRLILVCGHYEGVDERFVELCVDREVSIGDYVLTGGELPALVMTDTITRLLPGVVGNEDSITGDSLEDGLKYPQYTRPREFEGLKVPDILMSGDHGAIEKWRKAQSESRTAAKRPDLVSRRDRKKP
jgi:tRNA (guanine37-N1)-methyltransferase